MIVLSAILVPVIGIIVYMAIKGFSITRANTTIQVGDGKKVKVSKNEIYNVVLLLDALKTKDDISGISAITLKRQKRLARDVATSFRDNMLQFFRLLLVDCCNFDADNFENILSDRDYLYFSLLVENVYTHILRVILDDFEANGLAMKANPSDYARVRAGVVIGDIQNRINTLWFGIEEIKKEDFDDAVKNFLEDFESAVRSLYMDAIGISKKGQRKKIELENYLFEKVGEMEGISSDQFRKLFDKIDANDFLDE